MDFEITPREVIASVVIIAVMLILGLHISNKLQLSLLEKYQQYDSAVQIDTEEMFRHNMGIDIGNAFVYGELVALDTVTFDQIGGQYSYIEKQEQEYRRHVRYVTKTHKRADGSTYTTREKEYYWTWDTMRTEKKHSTRISFLNVEFGYEQIPFPSSHHVTTVSTGYHKRNVYYGTGTKFTGTIFTYLRNSTINNTSFYQKTIPETIEDLETGWELILFWVFWILLTGALVFGFYYLDNWWLE